VALPWGEQTWTQALLLLLLPLRLLVHQYEAFTHRTAA
jgi:hypothetical protein